MLNLAIELAASYGRKQNLAPATVKLANDAKNNIQGSNIGPMVMRLDTAVTRSFGGGLFGGDYGYRR